MLLLESVSSTPFPKWGGVVHAIPIFAQFLVPDPSVTSPIILSNAVHTTPP